MITTVPSEGTPSPAALLPTMARARTSLRGLAPGRADVYFDQTSASPKDVSWRAQKLLKPRSPRLHAVTNGAAGGSQALFADLDQQTDDEIISALLDNDLNTTTFLEYLQHSALGSPTRLLPWLQTLAALTSKVGLLLESTRFLCSDLQLARILLHMQTSAKSICGGKRAIAQ